MRVLLILVFTCCLVGYQKTSAQVSKYSEFGSDPSKVSDARVLSRLGTSNYGSITAFDALAGTYSGSDQKSRSFLKFDDLFDKVPTGAIIDSAKLELFVAMPQWWPHATNNSFYLARVVDPWDEMLVTYLTQPNIETSDQILNSNVYPLYYEGWEGMDVTSHVQYFVDSPNEYNGWGIRLATEVRYRFVRFYSSDYNGGSHTPKLKVWYKVPLYNELSIEHDGGYYNTIGKQLYFKHLFDYNQDVLEYKVYRDDSGIDVSLNTLIDRHERVLSYNNYKLDCSLLTDGYYILEVTNEKNQKYVLRFHNKL